MSHLKTRRVTITLPRSVNFLYEETLARVEIRALGSQVRRRDPDDGKVLSATVNGNLHALQARSAYVESVDGRLSTYSELTLPAYQGGQFNRTRSENQYLTHWIYPYRGKFHPRMVRALLNIVGVTAGATVLDPYAGSGTTALETSLLGARFVGVDMSPLCALLNRVKTESHKSVVGIRGRVRDLLEETDLHPDDVDPASERDVRVAEFLQVARMVTYSDVARRRRDPGKFLRRNLESMLSSVEAHARAITQFGIKPGSVTVSTGDARDLAASGIKPNSSDAVVTSPPYSIALDYVKNDDHALTALGIDTDALRDAMTGVRGTGAKEKLALYNDDMQRMFSEVATVLRPGARAAFVVGDATVDGREVTTTETMAEWGAEAGLRRDRTINKIVFGLYNVMRDEKILIFSKP